MEIFWIHKIKEGYLYCCKREGVLKKMPSRLGKNVFAFTKKYKQGR